MPLLRVPVTPVADGQGGAGGWDGWVVSQGASCGRTPARNTRTHAVQDVRFKQTPSNTQTCVCARRSHTDTEVHCTPAAVFAKPYTLCLRRLVVPLAKPCAAQRTNGERPATAGQQDLAGDMGVAPESPVGGMRHKLGQGIHAACVAEHAQCNTHLETRDPSPKQSDKCVHRIDNACCPI